MKGIIIAGGNGTRLFPMNDICNKHLLPVCDKPVIYYPLALLMEAQINEIVIVIKSNDYEKYFQLLGDGQRLGIIIHYVFQDKPLGIADALYRCKKHIDDRFVVILGDNFFHSGNVAEMLYKQRYNYNISGEMVIFSVPCADSTVATSAVFSEDGKVTKLLFKEKQNTRSVCPGLYIYDKQVFERIECLSPSKRNELEIIDLNRLYLREKKLNIIQLSSDTVWLDLGTFEDRILAENYVDLLEKIQGTKVACLEEIALNNKWISEESIIVLYKNATSSYIDYVKSLVRGSEDE